jgi:signal transduction histidine kinase
MDQAALALLNIDQAQRLHALYQANIQRTEAERLKIARDLHDEVLGPLGIVMMNNSATLDNQALYASVKEAIDHIRTIIEDVRPSVLDQGLYLAIVELTNRLSEYPSYQIVLQNRVKSDGSRYPFDVESHIYRILQEACLNAIRHGKARQIIISGEMNPESIVLSLQDNGEGFNSNDLIDITSLLRNRHFGLISIYERAALIGAEVKIASTPKHGARVSLNWQL